MNPNDYRQKIAQSVAKAQARRVKTRSANDTETVRRVVLNRKAAAKTRVEALGRLTRAEGPDVIPHTTLERLSDPKELPVVRLAAVKLLQQQQIVSSVAAEWRPAFVDGLRTALADPKVRAAAVEVLSLMKDRPTQERLLQGIRNAKQALVPLHEALRLLSNDVHADVIDVAKQLTDTPQLRKNKAAFVQAVRILAADPSSVGKLQAILANDAYAVDTRRLAATAISHLSPQVLQGTESPSQPESARRARRGGGRASGAKGSARPTGALATHLETLRRIRE